MNLASRMYHFSNRHPQFGKIISKLMRLVFSCDIRCGGGNICSGTELKHNGLGIVISVMAIVGRDCEIYQHVTIGAGKDGYPTIGNRVIVYPNCTIIGKITIGDDVVIGANSFVNKDIPAGTTVGGVPAKAIRK